MIFILIEGVWSLTAGVGGFAGHRLARLQNPVAGFQACETHAPPRVFWAIPHASRMWARGVLFRPRAPPPRSSVVDRASSTLSFLVWFLDLVVLVLFASDNPLFLGFLLDFSKICVLGVLFALDLLPVVS